VKRVRLVTRSLLSYFPSLNFVDDGHSFFFSEKIKWVDYSFYLKGNYVLNEGMMDIFKAISM